ncbi:hypothetical protein [Helicobacter fennelliae]|nr:hypothetical protein [Helicobacter fennelliae]
MVQEAVKYEKELAKLGIDTGRVGGILGQLDSITNGVLTSIQAVGNLPLGLNQIFAQLNESCDLLKGNEKFKNEIAKEKSKLEDITYEIKEQTACLKVINNAKFIGEESYKETMEAKEALKQGDFDKYNSKVNYVKNLYRAREYMNKQATLGKVQNYDKMYSYYSGGTGGAAGASKKEMTERHKSLLEQAKKSNTQEDAQNLGNQLLAEVINMLRMQYDMLMEYNSAMLSLQSQDLNTAKSKPMQVTDEELKEQKAKVDIFATDSPFEKYKGDYKKDALGLPIIGVGSK